MAAGRAAPRASAEEVVTGRRTPSPPPAPARSRACADIAHHVISMITSSQETKRQSKMRVDYLAGNSSRGYRSPHHRMPLHSRNEDSKRMSMAWRYTCASPYRGGSGGRLRSGRRRSVGRRGARPPSARARRRAGGPLRTSTCTEMGACLMNLLNCWQGGCSTRADSVRLNSKSVECLFSIRPPGDKDGGAQI